MAEKNDILVQVDHLKKYFPVKGVKGPGVRAVEDVSLFIRRGETLGLVGESGCGKSLTNKAILGINDKKCASTGEILFRNDQDEVVDLLKLNPRGKEIRAIRGKQISMIFQEPMVAFSPMYTIGNQINECTRLHITKDKQRPRTSIVFHLRVL